jgi:hypothetical protein
MHLNLTLEVVLSGSLANLDQFDDQYYLLSELDAIREVLFMLSGWECILFKTVNDNIEVSIVLENC